MKKMVRTIDFKFNSVGFETKFKIIIHFTGSTLSLTNNCRSNCQLAVELPAGGPTGSPTSNWQFDRQMLVRLKVDHVKRIIVLNFVSKPVELNLKSMVRTIFFISVKKFYSKLFKKKSFDCYKVDKLSSSKIDHIFFLNFFRINFFYRNKKNGPNY